MDPSLWLPNRDARPGVRLRLLCFAHAGAGATPFLRWGAALPALIVSGEQDAQDAAATAPVLRKPARPVQLRSTLQHLLQSAA